MGQKVLPQQKPPYVPVPFTVPKKLKIEQYHLYSKNREIAPN